MRDLVSAKLERRIPTTFHSGLAYLSTFPQQGMLKWHEGEILDSTGDSEAQPINERYLNCIQLPEPSVCVQQLGALKMMTTSYEIIPNAHAFQILGCSHIQSGNGPGAIQPVVTNKGV